MGKAEWAEEEPSPQKCSRLLRPGPLWQRAGPVRPRARPCFFVNDTATTEIYTLSLHDALPISAGARHAAGTEAAGTSSPACPARRDRKSTRLNSSHPSISYAVFCLTKKKEISAALIIRIDYSQVSLPPSISSLH